MVQIHSSMDTPPVSTLTAGDDLADQPVAMPQKVVVIPHGRLAKVSAPVTVMAHDAAQAMSGFVCAYPRTDAILRQGWFELRQGRKAGKVLPAAQLLMPLPPHRKTHRLHRLHLIPVAAGASRGRGKAVLGLTLLGLSFVPGVNAGLGQSFAQFGQGFGLGGVNASATFQQFGNELLGRTGSLLLLSGLSDMLSPQTHAAAGHLPSASLPVPPIAGQGAAIPLIYGEVRITQPVVISSGLDVDVIAAA